ncbi:MAG: 23S rRNA (adenine(2503)-C(2))-methyltransferase RlmN [Candidatus Omnitrophica bacterium]|nr:23S rRNA (adenine(2503)-C(2))-methyltransferase RlmN [Candidatus Omnitrophota bacterium]
MQDIKDLDLKELEAVLTKYFVPSFHAEQIFSWIYKKGSKDFDSMSNLPKGLREKLKDDFYIYSLKLISELKSKDGTEKFLFELKDKNYIESVIIPAKRRVTACISSQVGCKFACQFCASGTSAFKRNLSTGEIIEQLLGSNFTHIVFMGIGEPLDNYDNVLKAIRIINSPFAFNIGSRRITISTCGLIPGIKRLMEEDLQIELSISLHAPTDELRNKLLPVNKKYPLKELMSVCKEYIEKTGRQITFEYILIKGINSDLQNAKNLSKIVKDLRLCKVNLIPCNSLKEVKIEAPRRSETLLFRDALLKMGINTTLRKPRGQDIEAACGQLRLRYEKR